MKEISGLCTNGDRSRGQRQQRLTQQSTICFQRCANDAPLTWCACERKERLDDCQSIGGDVSGRGVARLESPHACAGGGLQLSVVLGEEGATQVGIHTAAYISALSETVGVRWDGYSKRHGRAHMDDGQSGWVEALHYELLVFCLLSLMTRLAAMQCTFVAPKIPQRQ